MADDFQLWQGTNITPYYVVMDSNPPYSPVDLTTVIAATWIATPLFTSGYPIIKHLADVSYPLYVGTDPEYSGGGTPISNCVFVPLQPSDCGSATSVGQYNHELRITIGARQLIIYPAINTKGTFSIFASSSWNPTATPPAPRLSGEEPWLSNEEPKARIRVRTPSNELWDDINENK